MKFVIVGGTGLIGSKVVALLDGMGHAAVAASPNTGVDTITGAGLAPALAGADVVVDVSNSPSFADADVLDFFTTSTKNLLAAELAASVRHHVALSVVGSERLVDSGYMRAKVAQEALIEGSGIPWSIVHATQFYEFVTSIADAATVDGTVRLSSALIQPIAADDVARTVATVAAGAPLRARHEIGGPDRLGLDELVRHGLESRGDPRPVVVDDDATYFGARLDRDSLLPAADAERSTVTFDAWLAARA